jgi:AraC-like DNA-binding protein
MAKEEVIPTPQSDGPLRIEWFKYCERGRGYHTPAHIHRYLQWYHVVRGQVTANADKVPFVLDAGQSMLFPPETSREYIGWARPLAYFVIVFHTRANIDFSPLYCQVLRMPPILEGDMQSLIDEAKNPGADHGFLSQALLTRVLIGLKREMATQGLPQKAVGASPLTRNYNYALVERIEDFIRQNYHEPLSRDDIAARLSMSPGHVARVYRNLTGHTLVDRITQVRLEAAKNLLLNSTISVTRVALEVGYSSFSHFSKTFKDLEKISPGDYRRAKGASWEKFVNPNFR